MDKLTYTRDFDNELGDEDIDTREMSEIAFTFPDDLTIYEFKTICMRLAGALGYCEQNIEEAFGDEDVSATRGSLISQIQKK